MSNLLVYRTFPNPAVAQDLVALLDAEGVEYTTDYSPPSFSGIIGTSTPELFVLRLRPDDFTRVRQLEEAQAGEVLAELPADYYLFSFSNEELWDVLRKPAEWSSHDVALARDMLRERGETVTDDTLRNLRDYHTAALSVPESSPTGWIILGYIFALAGGLFGLCIGLSLWRLSKTLPDGRQIPSYTEADRNHGRRILMLSIMTISVALIIWGILVVQQSKAYESSF